MMQILTRLFVPTSNTMGKHSWGLIPANAVYKASFPTGMPIPQAPKSPRPKIRSPSVTTIALTFGSGLQQNDRSINSHLDVADGQIYRTHRILENNFPDVDNSRTTVFVWTKRLINSGYRNLNPYPWRQTPLTTKVVIIWTVFCWVLFLRYSCQTSSVLLFFFHPFHHIFYLTVPSCFCASLSGNFWC